ncbi:hypothetical protein C0992_003657 [Termitomyces sp. T32_za158]|nr:hypothetical protein C0992_003657 [Termitomyces sp. T32_za158]
MRPATPAQGCANILHPALPDVYNSDRASDKDQYEQGKRSLDNYIDLFQVFVEQANYSDDLQLCLTFQEGLHSALMDRIDNLAEGQPANNQVWFLAPEEQEELLLQLLAAWDSTEVPSPDVATQDNLEEEAPSAPVTEEMPEEGF